MISKNGNTNVKSWLLSTMLLFFFVDLSMSSPTFVRNRHARHISKNMNRTEIASKIRFRDYHGSTLDEFVEYSGYPLEKINIEKDEKRFGLRSKARRLVVYIHGYREGPTNESVRTVMGAYLKRESVRYVVVDWSRLVSGKYVTAVIHVTETARVVADYLKIMHAVLHSPSIHFVGHSLGAHVAGLVQRFVNFDIARVTGLDPANPGFYLSATDHLNRDSAIFVDVVHTDGGFYGVLQPTGTVDFYANGGTRPQPGCGLIGEVMSDYDLCSHWASWRYYARTITDEHAFPALKCSSLLDVKLGTCKQDGHVFFGDNTSTDARGIYYFATV